MELLQKDERNGGFCGGILRQPVKTQMVLAFYKMLVDLHVLYICFRTQAEAVDKPTRKQLSMIRHLCYNI